MYLVPLKTLLTEAIKKTFDSEYENADFRNLHASIEYPMERQNYPGIWIDYEPVGALFNTGIGHREFSEPGVDGTVREISRWRFQGNASFTCVALSSLERDRLHDEVVRTMAFGTEADSTSQFRQYIEDNEFLAVNFDFDKIETRGFASTFGTPWQSEDMIYECEIVMGCFGEFLSDHQSPALLPFNEIEFIAFSDTESDPTDPEGWV